MKRSLLASRLERGVFMLLVVAAAGSAAATAHAQVVFGGGVMVQRMQFGFGGGMRQARPVDEGSGLFPDDDFRRIGDPWWDDVAKDDEGEALAAVDQKPAADVPAGANVGDGDPKAGEVLDAARLSREQRDALAKESARLAAVTGMMTLRRELSAVRQLRPMLDEQQRSFVLAAGRKVLRERLAALDEKPLTRWTSEQKQGLAAAIRESIGAALAANDSDEARDAYVAEAARREDRRKRAAVDALVAEIDRDMQLSRAECDQLVGGLTEAYREAWRSVADQYPQGLAAGGGMQYLPTGVDRSVERILGKQRTAEWLARRPNADGQQGFAGPRRPGGLVRPGNGVRVIIERGAVEVE